MESLKAGDIPKGATHWQPKSDAYRECFYKKVPSGVSRYIVAPEDARCNQWDSSEGRGEVSIIEVFPIELKLNHDRLAEENADLIAVLSHAISGWDYEEVSHHCGVDAETASRVIELLNK